MGQSIGAKNGAKNGLSKIYGRQPLKNLKWYGLLRSTISLQIATSEIQCMKKLSKTETDLKKSVAYKKRCITLGKNRLSLSQNSYQIFYVFL